MINYSLLIIILFFNVSLISAVNKDYSSTSLILKFKKNSFLLSEARYYSSDNYFIRLNFHDAKLQNSLTLKSFMDDYFISEIYAMKPDAALMELPGGIERIFIVSLLGPGDVETIRNLLVQNKQIEYVEFDYFGTGGGVTLPEIVPDDRSFHNQWGLRNTGQTIDGYTGTSGGDINAVNAWDVTTGSANIKIAVLDSGIPLAHPEFSGRLIQGYDFVNNDSDPTDDNGHGTNITSIIGAKGNNNLLVAGVNWNSMTIPVKVIDQNKLGQYSWFASGITFAVDNGAKVINMSVGGSYFSEALLNALTYASANNRIVVASMMNNNNNQIYYPAGFSNVIAIGATNNRNKRAVPFCWGGGSSFGSHIDFCAPGEMILGLNYNNMNTTSFWCGTSAAAANVTGVVSLLVSIDSSLTFYQVYNALKNSARDQIGQTNEDSPGFDNYFGWGLINARGALDQLLVMNPPEVPNEYKLKQNYPNPFNPNTNISFNVPNGSERVLIEVYNVQGKKVLTLVDEQFLPGIYEVNFIASVYPSGVYFYRMVSGDFSEVKKMVLVK